MPRLSPSTLYGLKLHTTADDKPKVFNTDDLPRLKEALEYNRKLLAETPEGEVQKRRWIQEAIDWYERRIQEAEREICERLLDEYGQAEFDKRMAAFVPVTEG